MVLVLPVGEDLCHERREEERKLLLQNPRAQAPD